MTEKPAIRDRIIGLERIDASLLDAHPDNWRTHDDEQRTAVGNILGSVGWADAIIARKVGSRYQILDGHLRQESGGQIPVLVVDLNEDEANLVLATHDKLTMMAGIDNEAFRELASSLEFVSLSDFGWPEKELQQIVNEPTELSDEGDEVPDVSEELRKQWKTESGQLWSIGNHRLLIGDSTADECLATLFSELQWELCVTSPPYNQGVGSFSTSGMHKESNWTKNINKGSYPDAFPENEYQASQVAAVTAWRQYATANASMFYNHKNRFRDKQCISPWTWLEQCGKVRQEIVWRRNGSVTQNMRGFMPCDERIFWMYFGDDFIWNDETEYKTWSTVWEIAHHNDTGVEAAHGCVFPVELPARAIRACSHPKSIVFEPFLGSGTTMVAAEQLGRKCYGMEIDPGYAAVVLERLSRLGVQCARIDS